MFPIARNRLVPAIAHGVLRLSSLVGVHLDVTQSDVEVPCGFPSNQLA